MPRSIFIAKYILKTLDPDHDRKEKAAKARQELLTRLGVLPIQYVVFLSLVIFAQRTGIETNEHEDIIAKDAVNPASIDVTFDDIGGHLFFTKDPMLIKHFIVSSPENLQV